MKNKCSRVGSRRIIVLLASVLIFIIVILLFISRESSLDSKLPEGIREDCLYEVVRVKDGDTIVIDCNGENFTIRLIGIDAPESVHPDADKNTSQGEIASEFMKETLEGKSVSLEFDEELYDRYDRLLAYVYLEDEMLNALLLKKGYAKVTIYEPNHKYEDYFLSLQDVAKLKKTGFWENGEWSN
ncbi:MAG: thermonuclease family protein [Lachnospiraceae bacterium]